MHPELNSYHLWRHIIIIILFFYLFTKNTLQKVETTVGLCDWAKQLKMCETAFNSAKY